jgi:hypothetical protein
MRNIAWLVLVGIATVGCSSSPSTGGTDTGPGGTDTGTGGTDSGGGGTDTGLPGADGGATPDSGASGNDVGPTTYPDGGLMCTAGIECTNWAAAISAASSLNGAAGGTPDAALMNCVIQLHQSDCCGAQRAYGFNHAARMQLCTAESQCTMQYPTPAGCTSTTITTDTGETTTMSSQVRLRVVNPMSCMFGTCYTCQTFVCTDPSCMSAPTIMPRQCG